MYEIISYAYTGDADFEKSVEDYPTLRGVADPDICGEAQKMGGVLRSGNPSFN